MSDNPKSQETGDKVKNQHICRIPQRLPGRRPFGHSKTASAYKNKVEATSVHRPNYKMKYMGRPGSGESWSRPSSRGKDSNETTQVNVSRLTKPARERLLPAVRRPVLPIHKKAQNDNSHETPTNKAAKIITVPVKQKVMSKASNNDHQLPKKETVTTIEDLRDRYFSDESPVYDDMDKIFLDYNAEESVNQKSDKVMQLKTFWQEKIVQYERMKNELNNRQKVIMQVYSSLRNTKEKLTKFGQSANLPSTDDLRIMNVANMTPNQLLQLCADTRCTNTGNERKAENVEWHDFTDTNQPTIKALNVDMKKLNDMPAKLVAVCEQTLAMRKDFIDWFDNLKNNERACQKSTLTKKINEFNAETEMVIRSIQTIKNEFLNNVNEFMRMCWNETMAFQQRNEDLTHQLNELSSQNNDFKKRISNYEQQKIQLNRLKMEEVIKELKEEKEKAQIFKHRLERAECQAMTREKRTQSLEAALDQAREQTRTLERTVQQLNEQNQRLQKDFDEELNKLNEAMEKNTKQLEDIASAREILQSEKEEFKEKIKELTNHYNKSMNNLNAELNENISKLFDAEKKYKDQLEEKQILQAKVDSQSAELVEFELRYKETLKKLKETELNLNDMMRYKNELENVKNELDSKEKEIDKTSTLLKDQQEALQELKSNLKKSQGNEEKLKRDVGNKAEIIRGLEKKELILRQKCQENEHKMETYEEQLVTLKNHFTKLKDHFGEFENINDLHEIINKQKAQLHDARRLSNDLSTEIEQKRNELNNLTRTISEQEDLIKQRHDVLQMLSEKEEEHANILQLSQEISEKNSEIESLISNLEKRNLHITQLEKIILTMEEHNLKTRTQRQKDLEIINSLEDRVSKYETYINNKDREPQFENLDEFIKFLEDEITTPLDSQMMAYTNTKNTRQNDNNYKLNQNKLFANSTDNNIPTKIVMENSVKKTYDNISNNDKQKGDNLDRKQAITNIDTKNWMTNLNANIEYSARLPIDNFLHINEINPNNFQTDKSLKHNLATLNQARLEKKSKMFKFAGHRV